MVIAAPGNDGSDLSNFAYENYRSLRHPSFAEMKPKALIVVENQDVSPYLSKRGFANADRGKAWVGEHCGV